MNTIFICKGELLCPNVPYVESATHDVKPVALSTCVELVDIISRDCFTEALEANTNKSYLRPRELREAAR